MRGGREGLSRQELNSEVGRYNLLRVHRVRFNRLEHAKYSLRFVTRSIPWHAASVAMAQSHPRYSRRSLLCLDSGRPPTRDRLCLAIPWRGFRLTFPRVASSSLGTHSLEVRLDDRLRLPRIGLRMEPSKLTSLGFGFPATEIGILFSAAPWATPPGTVLNPFPALIFPFASELPPLPPLARPQPCRRPRRRAP